MISAKQMSEEQKARVRALASEGASLGEIQKRLAQEHGLTMTYLEARLLIGELGVALREPEPERPREKSPLAPDAVEGNAADAASAGGGKLTLTKSEVTPPGMFISGKVTFSDGERAEWYVDQMGRLGLQPDRPGYRPSEADVVAFQRELESLADREGL